MRLQDDALALVACVTNGPESGGLDPGAVDTSCQDVQSRDAEIHALLWPSGDAAPAG
jgi:hypothetical protein